MRLLIAAVVAAKENVLQLVDVLLTVVNHVDAYRARVPIAVFFFVTER